MIEKLSVSDHALVRYLERFKGQDLEAARDEIRALVAAGRSSLDGRAYRFLFVVEPSGDGEVVTTILAPEQRPKHNRRSRKQTIVEVSSPTSGNDVDSYMKLTDGDRQLLEILGAAGKD